MIQEIKQRKNWFVTTKFHIVYTKLNHLHNLLRLILSSNLVYCNHVKLQTLNDDVQYTYSIINQLWKMKGTILWQYVSGLASEIA
jgi:hypothetical protein